MHEYDIVTFDEQGDVLNIKTVETGLFLGDRLLGRSVREALTQTDPKHRPAIVRVYRRRISF